MRKHRPFARIVAVLALIACLATPALAQESGDADRVLTVRLPTDIKNLDPAYWFSRYDKDVAMPIYSGLIRHQPNSYETELELAESLDVSDDGTEIRFTLRQGVQCHRGYGELTADDVKFSFERFLDEENPSPYADDWRPLDRVDVTGRYEGTIVLSSAFAPLWNSTLPLMSGSVVCQEYVEEVGADVFATDPVGTGPYQFTSWDPNREIVLERNPDYFGDAPFYDEIRFVIISDEQTAELALQSGQVDFSEVQFSSLPLLERDAGVSTNVLPSLSYGWIGMNVENPKLEDVRVRQAIRLAIDVPSILIVAYEGAVERSNSLIAPGLNGHWEDATVFAQDLDAAKALVREAGAEGLELRMDIANTPEYRAWAQIAQQNLRQVGIELQINTMDTGSFWEIGGGDEGKNVELFGMNFAMEPDPSWATVWFTCDQIGVWNWMRWCNEEYDALHTEGLMTQDADERDAIYERMQELMEQDAIAVWIAHEASAYGYRSDLEPALTPHGVMQLEAFRGL